MQLLVSGERLVLLGEGALYWPRLETLMLADAHFGKAATFRAGGIPVPGGTTGDNLVRLATALAATGARRLICLGDLLHARAGRAPQTVDAVTTWRRQHPGLEWLLVRGNHDRHAGDPPAAWNVHCLDEPVVEAPFVLRHLPLEETGGYVLAGHVHPAVRVGRGKLAEQLPCFLFGQRVAILPAFGAFTGTAVLQPEPSDRVFVLAGGEVIAVR